MPKNTKKIILGDIEYLAIDLTQPLSLNTHGYPGDPHPKRKTFSAIDDSGWEHYTHELGDHCFQPHGDAPNHYNLESKNKGFEIFDIEYCFNQACLIDLSDSDDTQEIEGIKYLKKIKKEHLKPFSKKLSQKSAVLIRTGYDKWLEKNKPHTPENLPYLEKDTAEFIASFEKIRVFGTDSITVDRPGSHDSHQALANRLIVESLVHLYEIPAKNRLDFDLQTSPVRIVGATGGPVVAYAFIKI